MTKDVTGRDTYILTQALHDFAKRNRHTSNGEDAREILVSFWPEMAKMWDNIDKEVEQAKAAVKEQVEALETA